MIWTATAMGSAAKTARATLRLGRPCPVPLDERHFLPGDFPHGFQQHLMQDARLPVVVAMGRYKRLMILKCSASAAVAKRSISACDNCCEPFDLAMSYPRNLSVCQTTLPSIFIGLWIIKRFGRCSGCTSKPMVEPGISTTLIGKVTQRITSASDARRESDLPAMPHRASA